MKIGKKKWENIDDQEKIAHCDALFEDAKRARQKQDVKAYFNYRFLEGDHYISYNTTTNSLEKLPRRRGEVRAVVNKIKSTMRAVQNYSTRFNPKWEVVPGDTDEDTITNARRAGKVLDYLDRHLHLEIVRQGIIESGLNTSVAFVELDWDDQADYGMGQVKVIMHDYFDIYLDPRATIYAGLIKGSYVAKSVKRPTEEVQNDERYDKKNRKDVKPDDTLSDSEMKKRILTREGKQSDEKLKRSTVREFFLYDHEASNKEGKIILFTYSGDKVLRDERMEKKVDFPIYCFQVPQDTLKIYHQPWVSDLIPLNKILNRIVSQKVMYVNQALVFRMIAEKGHGANPISNEQGEFIEINAGRKFEQVQLHPLPQTLEQTERDVNNYIEDIGGAHEASLGRSPAGARSGDQIEALQAADANNLVGIRNSLESFLSVLGSAILDIVSEKYVASRVIKITEPEENVEAEQSNYLEVVGEGAPAKKEGATIINKDNEVIVKIGSWLGYTLDAQRKTLMDLAAAGVIPAEELLRQFEFPNINELSAKAREQRLEQHTLQAEIAGRNQPQGGGGQRPATRGGVDMAALADKENMQMMQGAQIPPTEGADLAHTQAHMDFMRSSTFQQAPQQIQQIIAAHTEGEMARHQTM